MTPDQWKTIRGLVDWLDRENGHGDHETAMRLMKLAEECGEVTAAYIGTVGQNPRKGVTHTREDVAGELCDVIVTAAVALHRFTDDPAGTLDGKLARIADRAAASERQARGPRCGNHPGAVLTDGDRQAVDEFREYLAARRDGMPPTPSGTIEDPAWRQR